MGGHSRAELHGAKVAAWIVEGCYVTGEWADPDLECQFCEKDLLLRRWKHLYNCTSSFLNLFLKWSAHAF